MRVAFAAILLSACGGGSGLTYDQMVKPLVDEKCTGCHVEGGIAPFSLTTYADVVAHQKEIKSAVSSRIMPPWPPDPKCNEFQSSRALTDAQIKTIVDWIDAGAKEGKPGAATQMQPHVGLSRVDAKVSMTEAYTPKISPDEYRCFVLDWPESQVKYVTGFRAVPGTPAIVHHVIAFLATPDQVANYVNNDAADPAPGYTCFGGPGGGNPSWLGAWAPGGQGTDLPPGTGLEVQPGSKIVLQVHYNTLYTSPVPDQTSVEVKLDDQVDKKAQLVPWTNPAWVSLHTMDIPAGQSDVSHNFQIDPSPYLSRATKGVLTNNQPFTIYSAALHMHTRGTRAELDIIRQSGGDECMLSIPRWDFHWQDEYMFQTPVRFNVGDQLNIECHWDNSAANQPVVNGTALQPQDLNWGEGTTDEMCLGLLYVSP